MNRKGNSKLKKKLRKFLLTLKTFFVSSNNDLPDMEYWEKRSKQYGRRSVLNISHTNEEFESVTQLQKKEIFPHLKDSLKGDEKIILDFGCGPGRFTKDLADIIKGKSCGVDPISHLIKFAPKGNNTLAQLPIGLPPAPELDTRHAYHLYTIQVDEAKTGLSRDAFLNAMTAHNIGVGVHYLSIPEHPYYQQTFGWKPEDYPNAMKIGRQTVSLPLSAKLTDTDVEDVIHTVQQLIRA